MELRAFPSDDAAAQRDMSPPTEIRLEREATLLSIHIKRGPPRPMTSSPMSEPPTSPQPIFTPLPDYSPVTKRRPTETDTEELLDFIRTNQRKSSGLDPGSGATVSWMDKKKPLVPDIAGTSRSKETLHVQSTSSLQSSKSTLSRSLENIPGPNPKLLEQRRLQPPTGKVRVARLRSLPPIEITLDRPSAPGPAERNLIFDDDEDPFDDSTPADNADKLAFTI